MKWWGSSGQPQSGGLAHRPRWRSGGGARGSRGQPVCGFGSGGGGRRRANDEQGLVRVWGSGAGRGGGRRGRLQGAGREVRPRRLRRWRGRVAAVQAGGAAAGRAGGAATGERHEKFWQPNGVPRARTSEMRISPEKWPIYRKRFLGAGGGLTHK